MKSIMKAYGLGNLLRSLQWYVVSILSLVGMWAMHWAHANDSMKSLIVCVFAWGAAFIIGLFVVKFGKNTLVGTFLLWAVTAFVSQTQYIPAWLYIYGGVNIVSFGFWGVWAVLLLAVALLIVPMMFEKID